MASGNKPKKTSRPKIKSPSSQVPPKTNAKVLSTPPETSPSTLLKFLTIRNLATIESLELEFQTGLNVITGETGTGKSTILSAIALILGERADTQLLRSGCEELSVEAIFENSTAGHEDDDLIIRRSVNRSGKGKILINGHFATRAELAQLTQSLVDLCSQHEHQSLSKPAHQLTMLDSYLGLDNQRNMLEGIFQQRATLLKDLESLEQNKKDLPRVLDFLQFQLSEIESAQLQVDEEETLLSLKQKLLFGKSLSESLNAVLQHLSSAEMSGGSDAPALGAIDNLQIVHRRLSKAAEQHPDLQTFILAAEQALSVLEDLLQSLERYHSELSLDPESLQQVQERLSILQMLKRKYGPTLQDVLNSQLRLQDEFEGLTKISQSSEELKLCLLQLEGKYIKLAGTLSQERRAGAQVLEQSIQAELNELKMSGVEFKILFNEKSADAKVHFTTTGFDEISFCFAPNQGEGLKPISRIASGGELSRIMLAVRRVIANQGGIGVYLFDEIDAGIGGLTATVVGKKLRSVAAHHQVICITHLPQIAAFAENHHRVEKRTDQNRTFTNVRRLKENEERISELARMSGAEASNKKARAHVLELLRMAQK